MKKFIVTLAASLLLSSAAVAQHRYGHHNPHHHHHFHRGGSHWVAPAIGGLIIGAAIANSYATPAPVIVQPQVVTPAPRAEYYSCLVQVYDSNLNTYRNEVMTCVR